MYYGITIGSLLVVTLGNSTEIIVGIVSVNEGLFDLFKGTMIDGILANILLIPGLSSAISAFGFREQRFDKEGGRFTIDFAIVLRRRLTIPTVISVSYLLQTNSENPLNL